MVDSSTYLPQDIARRQKMAEALLYGAMKPRTIHNVGEGIAQMGQALLGGIMTRNESKQNAEHNASALSALSGIGSSADVTAPPSTPAPQAVPAPPPAQPQTSEVTPDKQSFLASLTPAAQEVSQQTGVDPRIILAQAALETGWGKSAPGNNYFGIKSHGKPGGNTLATTEVVNGQPVQETASFRGYADPSESVRDYGNFLQSNPRYKPMLSAQGMDAQIAALGQSGYATDPDYAAKIRSIAGGLPQLGTNSPDQDTASLATAQPAALNRTLPMAQALANPTAPVSIPDNNPLRSNQQQSAGDFARADGRRRMAMAMSGQPMPSAPPPMVGNGSPAPMQQPRPAMGAPVQPGAPTAPQQAGNPRRAQLLKIMGDQRVSPELRKYAALQLQNEMTAEKPVEVNNRLVDPRTGRVIADFSDGGKPPTVTDFYDPKTGQPYKAQWNPQTHAWDRVGGTKAPNGTSLTVGPDGEVSFTQGGAPKAPTESQSKTITYITRAAGALPVLDGLADHLTKFGEGVGAKIPLVGNYLKSPEYQQAEQAGREFLQAVLRKDTGATITKEETAEYGVVYLPQPGDSVAVLKQKRVARHRALKAMELGLPPQQILSLEREGVDTSGGNAMPEQPTTKADAPAKPTTQQEFDALPSGAVYVDPDDGKTYRKR